VRCRGQLAVTYCQKRLPNEALPRHTHNRVHIQLKIPTVAKNQIPLRYPGRRPGRTPGFRPVADRFKLSRHVEI